MAVGALGRGGGGGQGSMALRKSQLWAATAVTGLLFFGSAYPMAERIRDFNAKQHYPHFHAEELDSREPTFRGFLPVKLTDHPGEGDQPFTVELRYGDTPPVYIPVKKPAAFNLPGLGIYDEWLKVLTVNEVERGGGGVQHAKPGSERLLIVVRRTPEGFDPETWGSVRRTEWLFDFYDLKPDGTVVTYTHRWPRKDMREEQFQERAAAPDAKPWDQALAKIPPLSERSVEYFAALHVIPKLSVPQHKFSDTAFTPRVMGWTLPVSMLSGLAFFVLLFFALAPQTNRDAAVEMK